jgi:hypothetical protein
VHRFINHQAHPIPRALEFVAGSVRAQGEHTARPLMASASSVVARSYR